MLVLMNRELAQKDQVFATCNIIIVISYKMSSDTWVAVKSQHHHTSLPLFAINSLVIIAFTVVIDAKRQNDTRELPFRAIRV